MRLLVAISNPAIADQIRVGLAAFGDIDVEIASGMLALDKIRRTELSGVMIALEPGVKENEELLERIQKEQTTVELIVLAHEAILHKLREDKIRSRIFAFLHLPIDPIEFFRAVNRLRRKKALARVR